MLGGVLYTGVIYMFTYIIFMYTYRRCYIQVLFIFIFREGVILILFTCILIGGVIYRCHYMYTYRCYIQVLFICILIGGVIYRCYLYLYLEKVLYTGVIYMFIYRGCYIQVLLNVHL